MAQMVKHLPEMWETQVQSLDWKDPLEKEMTTHCSLPGKSHGQKNLVSYSHGIASFRHNLVIKKTQ